MGQYADSHASICKKTTLRTKVLVAISRRLVRPPAKRTLDYADYEAWRDQSLSQSWAAFSDTGVDGKDVLDFGCGDGPLTFYMASAKQPKRILGVDVNESAIRRARSRLEKASLTGTVDVDFIVGSEASLPVEERSFDTLLAFDCMEHVMSPGTILREWYRILRPGGRCLIEWFPFKGPWGPHMESLIPVPWANLLFGEHAMFRAAEIIYDHPDFIPRHWDLDEYGQKKPNKWAAWLSFKEQAYVNQLDVPTFFSLAKDAGFEVKRFERHSFSGSLWRRAAGRLLMSLPLIGEYFVSYVVIELLRPKLA